MGFACFIFFSTIFTALLPPSLSLSFALQNNFTLYADSYFTRDSISLTRDPRASVGRALYTDPLRFLDPSTNSTASFSCKFSFTITPTPFGGKLGDGLAFLITSNATSLSTSSGYMGLPSPTTGATQQDSFIAVEFDTSFDPFLGDINDNHIGLDVDTVVSLASVGGKSIGIDLRSGRIITSWIEYENRNKMLRVWVSYSPFKPTDPVISTRVDLADNVLKEFMHVGFSASNGKMGSARHVVKSWQFRTYGFLNSNIGQELADDDDDDCLTSICFPEVDDFAAQYRFLHPGRKVSKLEKVFIGLGGGAALVLVSAVAMASWIRWKKRSVGRGGSGTRRVRQILPGRLSLAEVRSATRGFHRSRIIGEGASGVVYEGTLGSGKEVAVKRFSQTSYSNPFINPFTNELAAMAGSIKHKSLVQLLGWCCEGNELVLVYEYMPNGSLDKFIHSTGSTAPTVLTWEQRRKIVLGVASALVYLHEECEIQIIHRDVKTCNIMLDAQFNAKLGDFGLAELYDRGATTRDATIPAGTVGYLAPEYVHSGVPTEKTDVYSFGVVVLEVSTGRRPVDTYRNVLVDKVWAMWAKGKLMDLVDHRLMGRFDRVEMKGMLMVGLACVHPDCRKRPTMKEAERMLRGEAAFPVLPSRRPSIRLGAGERQGDRDGSNDTPWATPLTHFS